MLISLNILSLILVLLQSVYSVDLYTPKRISRDLQKYKRRYNFNRPPSSEIPVKVVYDNEEDIPVTAKSVMEATTIPKYLKKKFKPSNKDSVTQTTLPPVTELANHPPIVEKYDAIPVAIVNETKEEKIDIKQDEIESVSKIADQEKRTPEVETTAVVKNSNVTKVVKKLKGRSIAIEPQKSENNANLSSTTSRPRKVFQGKRLHESTKKNDSQNPTATEEATEKVPVATSTQRNKTPLVNSESKTYTFPKRMQAPDPVVPIVGIENYVYAYNGGYHYSYEGGDGTKAFEKGELKSAEDGSKGAGVVGGFSYKDKDGNDFSLSYTADENGYRPTGAHLPTPPPIPPEILHALEILATKTTPEPITERTNKF